MRASGLAAYRWPAPTRSSGHWGPAPIASAWRCRWICRRTIRARRRWWSGCRCDHRGRAGHAKCRNRSSAPMELSELVVRSRICRSSSAALAMTLASTAACWVRGDRTGIDVGSDRRQLTNGTRPGRRRPPHGRAQAPKAVPIGWQENQRLGAGRDGERPVGKYRQPDIDIEDFETLRPYRCRTAVPSGRARPRLSAPAVTMVRPLPLLSDRPAISRVGPVVGLRDCRVADGKIVAWPEFIIERRRRSWRQAR